MWFIFPIPTPPFFPYFLLTPSESIASSEPWCKIAGQGVSADTCLFFFLLLSLPLHSSLPLAFTSLICTRRLHQLCEWAHQSPLLSSCLIMSWDCHKADSKELNVIASCIQSACFKGYIFSVLTCFQSYRKVAGVVVQRMPDTHHPLPQMVAFTRFAVSHSFSRSFSRR